MKTTAQKPADVESVAPVTILDGTGRVVRTISADEFRRTHGIPERPKLEMLRRSRRSRPSEPVQDDKAVAETAVDATAVDETDLDEADNTVAV
jgi:hypothetical protein